MNTIFEDHPRPWKMENHIVKDSNGDNVFGSDLPIDDSILRSIVFTSNALPEFKKVLVEISDNLKALGTSFTEDCLFDTQISVEYLLGKIKVIEHFICGTTASKQPENTNADELSQMIIDKVYQKLHENCNSKENEH